MQPYLPDPSFEASATPATGNEEVQNKHRRLFRRGLRFLCIGMVLMGMSFAVNFLLIDTETSFIFAMYTLTLLGMGCMIKGLFDVMG